MQPIDMSGACPHRRQYGYTWASLHHLEDCCVHHCPWTCPLCCPGSAEGAYSCVSRPSPQHQCGRTHHLALASVLAAEVEASLSRAPLLLSVSMVCPCATSMSGVLAVNPARHMGTVGHYRTSAAAKAGSDQSNMSPIPHVATWSCLSLTGLGVDLWSTVLPHGLSPAVHGADTGLLVACCFPGHTLASGPGTRVCMWGGVSARIWGVLMPCHLETSGTVSSCCVQGSHALPWHRRLCLSCPTGDGCS